MYCDGIEVVVLFTHYSISSHSLDLSLRNLGNRNSLEQDNENCAHLLPFVDRKKKPTPETEGIV
jgi:hypothetical protein